MLELGLGDVVCGGEPGITSGGAAAEARARKGGTHGGRGECSGSVSARQRGPPRTCPIFDPVFDRCVAAPQASKSSCPRAGAARLRCCWCWILCWHCFLAPALLLLLLLFLCYCFPSALRLPDERRHEHDLARSQRDAPPTSGELLHRRRVTADRGTSCLPTHLHTTHTHTSLSAPHPPPRNTCSRTGKRSSMPTRS